MFGWFGRMLTFEVIADQSAVGLGALLKDCSQHIIEADDSRLIAGFAAHGSSIRDSLQSLVEPYGLELADRAGKLLSSSDVDPELILDHELGCDADGGGAAKVERSRAPHSSMPASLALTYYDRDRDFQAGQARASSGRHGLRDEQAELPAVLTAGEARQLAETAIARRWRASDRLKLRLPPTRIGLRTGDAIQLAGEPNAWTIASASIDGMAVVIEAEAASVAVQPLPADGGRSVSEPDLVAGRNELMLFELPPEGDTPAPAPRPLLAASNEGLWKRLPVELKLGSDPLPGVVLARRAVVGRAETPLEPRVPIIRDDLSSVIVRLANQDQTLFHTDWEALAAGANLALVGEELIQFGRAEPLGEGRFRLSRLLRGRRGTEWAAKGHAIGDAFCLIDPGLMVVAEMPAGTVGATLTAVAHGIGDVAPLPEAQRLMRGEAMRPPSPCHLNVRKTGSALAVEWVRRSYRGWAWIDGFGDPTDGFPERYRLMATTPNGEVVVETASSSTLLELSRLPAQSGDQVEISVVTIGPLAPSRPAIATITL